MNDSDRQPGPPADQYNAGVRDAVVGAYYPRILARADAARSRAQSAYAIASAIAGGLVGAALLSNLADVATWIKTLGILALSCWLIASSLYIRAVSRTVPVVTGPQKDVDALVRTVLGNVATELGQIERWLNNANRVSALAMLLTAAVFGAALFLGFGKDGQHGTLVLTDAGAKALTGTCDLPRNSIAGTIRLDTLKDAFVEITTDTGACRGRRLHLWIAKDEIITVESAGRVS